MRRHALSNCISARQVTHSLKLLPSWPEIKAARTLLLMEALGPNNAQPALV